MTPFTPHEAPATDLNSLPLQHPGRPIGRDSALREAYTVLQSSAPLVLLGASGIGKTALAAALAAAYIQKPGGVLWLNAEGRTLSDLLSQVGRAYRAPEVTNTDQLSAMMSSVQALLSRHQPLIVLDCVRQPAPLANVITPFAEKVARGLPVMILSETPLEGLGQAITLGPLVDVDALTLLQQKAGISDDSQDLHLYGIAKLVGYTPLGLVVAARGLVAAKLSPAEYYKALDTVAKTQKDGLAAAIATSYRALNNALQGLALLLSATPRGEAGVDLLSHLSNAPADNIDQAMNLLAQLYLVERFSRYGRPYYRMHARVRAFARELLQGSNRLDGLVEKVRDGLLAYLKQAVKDQAYARIAAEMDSVLSLAEDLADQGERDWANQCLLVLTQADQFIQQAGYVQELIRLQRASVSSSAAFPAYGALIEDDHDAYDLDDLDNLADEEEALDEADQALLRDAAARRASLLADDEDDEDEAFDDEEVSPPPSAPIYQPGPPPVDLARSETLLSVDVEQLRTALAQAKQARDVPRQLQILKAIGKVQIRQGREAEAIPTYNEALNLAETHNDEDAVLDILDILAALLSKTGNVQAAIMHATRGAQLAQTRGETSTLMSLLLTLGDARQELGESQAAIDVFGRAVTLARQSNDQQYEAIALYKLGYAHLDNGDAETPISLWEQARELFKRQGKRDYEGRVLGGMGAAYAEQGHWSEAMRYIQSALYIAREVGDQEEEMLQLGSLARAQVELKQLPEALISYRQALHLAYESGNPDNIVTAIIDLVRLMSQSARLLGICKLLLQDAENVDPTDREVQALMEDVEKRLAEVGARGVVQAPIKGTGRDYAANAYSLLER
ncbi:MAG: tetratricopeptide repeat protein [Anaerolineae bacterium]|nr:tetratricopeptide repeat protein [Anaerolineae bacterium]MDW8173769.1 tetratricopeptide repeat protein [Anaerolineae bacterium]